MILEVCVDDAGGLAAAIEGGADRIELCAALALRRTAARCATTSPPPAPQGFPAW